MMEHESQEKGFAVAVGGNSVGSGLKNLPRLTGKRHGPPLTDTCLHKNAHPAGRQNTSASYRAPKDSGHSSSASAPLLALGRSTPRPRQPLFDVQNLSKPNSATLGSDLPDFRLQTPAYHHTSPTSTPSGMASPAKPAAPWVVKLTHEAVEQGLPTDKIRQKLVLEGAEPNVIDLVLDGHSPISSQIEPSSPTSPQRRQLSAR